MNSLLAYQLKKIGHDGSLSESQTLSLLAAINEAYNKADENRAYQRTMLDSAKSKITTLHNRINDYKSAEFTQAEIKYQRLLSNLQPNYFFYGKTNEGRFSSISESVFNMLGFTPKEFIAQYDDYFMTGLRSDLETKRLISEYGFNVPYELNLKSKNGILFYLEITEYLVHDNSGNVIGIEGIVRDITEHVASKNKVSNMLYRDTLTGISNRLHLEVLMERLILDNRTKNDTFSMLFLDLDHFKHINDTLGHDIGDLLLQNFTSTVSDNMKDNDIFARIGGDEFVIIYKNIKKTELTIAIENLMILIQQTWKINQYNLNISASVGVVVYPEDGKTTADLMKSADIAMYESKNTGRNNFTFFNKKQNVIVSNAMELIQDMSTALDNNEFILYFQPKVQLSDNEVISSEALVRWKHPTKGYIGPGVFIPLAESTGFILALGKWIISEACKSIAWLNECNGGKKLQLSINISIRQFQHQSIYELLKDNIEKYGIDAEQISIEITESIMLENYDEMAEKLNKIKALGVHISLDDFGTGYSTLSYLNKLSIDELKIDKAFVDEIPTSGDKSIVLDTIIAMGKTLNMSVVAEGVEHEYQRDYLKQKGCDIYQGYLFSKPIPLNEYIAQHVI